MNLWETSPSSFNQYPQGPYRRRHRQRRTREEEEERRGSIHTHNIRDSFTALFTAALHIRSPKWPVEHGIMIRNNLQGHVKIYCTIKYYRHRGAVILTIILTVKCRGGGCGVVIGGNKYFCSDKTTILSFRYYYCECTVKKTFDTWGRVWHCRKWKVRNV